MLNQDALLTEVVPGKYLVGYPPGMVRGEREEALSAMSAAGVEVLGWLPRSPKWIFYRVPGWPEIPENSSE